MRKPGKLQAAVIKCFRSRGGIATNRDHVHTDVLGTCYAPYRSGRGMGRDYVDYASMFKAMQALIKAGLIEQTGPTSYRLTEAVNEL